jgi:glycosyltransferase involved in cell wall biosynthesis
MKPFLSILIPTYNRAEMTLEAIASVGNNPEVETVVNDDHSNDEEWDGIIDISFLGFSNLRIHRNETNLGMTKNFNRCMQLAQGEWFGLIGSDDYYKPGAVDRAVNLLHSIDSPSLVVYSRSTKTVINPPGYETVKNFRLPSGSGNFWHRSIYEDLGGFDERLLFSPDAEYWYRMVAKYPLVEVPERYCVVRSDHGDNLAYKTWRKRDEFLKQIKLITRLNMVHRGEDTTDLDLVVANEGKAVWDTVLYILKVTSTKPDKFDIFDMYLDAGLRLAFTKDRLDAIKSLMNARNKK